MEPDVLCRVIEKALQELRRAGLLDEVTHVGHQELGEAGRLLSGGRSFVFHPYPGTETAG